MSDLEKRLTVAPCSKHPDGRLIRISDGYHSLADYKAGKARRSHRGCDFLYRRPKPLPFVHPYASKWYEIGPPAPEGYDIPALAQGWGVVRAASLLSTGWWVALDHGDGLGVAYHHLREVWVKEGQEVGPGVPVGLVGGSPVGYGLWHLHADHAHGCAWKRHRKLERLDGTCYDFAPFYRTWKHMAHDEALALDPRGRVDLPPIDLSWASRLIERVAWWR